MMLSPDPENLLWSLVALSHLPSGGEVVGSIREHGGTEEGAAGARLSLCSMTFTDVARQPPAHACFRGSLEHDTT